MDRPHDLNEGEQAIGRDECQRGIMECRAQSTRLMPRWWRRACGVPARRRSASLLLLPGNTEPARRIVDALRQQLFDALLVRQTPRPAPAFKGYAAAPPSPLPPPLLLAPPPLPPLPPAAQHRPPARVPSPPPPSLGRALPHAYEELDNVLRRTSWCSGRRASSTRWACLAGHGSLARKKSRSNRVLRLLRPLVLQQRQLRRRRRTEAHARPTRAHSKDRCDNRLAQLGRAAHRTTAPRARLMSLRRSRSGASSPAGCRGTHACARRRRRSWHRGVAGVQSPPRRRARRGEAAQRRRQRAAGAAAAGVCSVENNARRNGAAASASPAPASEGVVGSIVPSERVRAITLSMGASALQRAEALLVQSGTRAPGLLRVGATCLEAARRRARGGSGRAASEEPHPLRGDDAVAARRRAVRARSDSTLGEAAGGKPQTRRCALVELRDQQEAAAHGEGGWALEPCADERSASRRRRPPPVPRARRAPTAATPHQRPSRAWASVASAARSWPTHASTRATCERAGSSCTACRAARASSSCAT